MFKILKLQVSASNSIKQGPDHQILSLQRLHRATPAQRHPSGAHIGRRSCAQVAAVEVAVAEGFEEVQDLLGKWDGMV